MKKLLLLGAGLSLAFCLQAQQRPAKQLIQLDPAIAKKAVPAHQQRLNIEAELPLNPNTTTSPYLGRTSSAVSEAIVGTTEYDLQTNRSTAKRISNNGDGTISIVWTGSADRNGWPDRGTWYNYFDGTSWGTQTGPLEPMRAGFTNIDVEGGVEYTLAHSGASEGVLSSRTKGTGSWTSVFPVGGPLPTGFTDVWWRLAVGGPNNNTIHAIVNSQGTGTTPVAGQSGPITYSRSQDGGQTWDIQHLIIPDIDSSNYWGFSAEDYHIDARGNTVAIVLGGFVNDVVLLKSTDNGTTWTKTIVMAFPDQTYMTSDPTPGITDPDGDGIADTLETNSGDVTVTLDNNSMAHVSFGRMLTLDDDPTAVESYFPGTDGLYYWNETMSTPIIIAGVEDLNGDGDVIFPVNADFSFGLYNAGLTQQPSIGIDAQNNIYIAYSTINELTDTTIFQQLLRHVWAIKSTDGGMTWSLPLDLVPMAAQGGDGEFQEAVFPSMATLVDNNIHVTYQRDIAPGHSLGDPTQAPNNTTTNDIIYVTAPVTDLVTGVNEATSPSQSFSISQNYPNPFKGTSRFELNLVKSADATLEIRNVYGQLVSSESLGKLPAGVHAVTLDGRNLSAGMYYFTVNANGEQLSKNFMIR
jgi:hypothetical protein